jgi:hypothetical protein
MYNKKQIVCRVQIFGIQSLFVLIQFELDQIVHDRPYITVNLGRIPLILKSGTSLEAIMSIAEGLRLISGQLLGSFSCKILLLQSTDIIDHYMGFFYFLLLWRYYKIIFISTFLYSPCSIPNCISFNREY